MAHVVADRVKVTSTTTGTGTYTLGSTTTGFQAFSVIGDGNTTWYCATDDTDWEVGLGTYTAAGTTLARTKILASSNAGAAVNWAAGTRTIFGNLPAARIGSVVRRTTTSGLTLGADHNGQLIAFTGSADITHAFDAAATIGAGWSVRLHNAGTAQARVLLDPNGAETIDGLTSFKMFPGEVRDVFCDGTNLTSVVLRGFQMLYAAGSYSSEPVPPGYKTIEFEMWGGGGGGGGKSSAGRNGGGGGGAHYPPTVVDIGSATTFDVVAAASAAGGTNANGTAGNNSTFTINSITYTAFGGGRGIGNVSSGTNNGGGGGGGLLGAGGNGAVGTGGAGGTGALSVYGSTGATGSIADSTPPNSVGHGGGGGGGGGAVGCAGGASEWGGGGGGGAGAASAGGVSTYGGSGGASANTGVAGTVPGGGGGGGIAGTGGAGAAGQVYVRASAG